MTEGRTATSAFHEAMPLGLRRRLFARGRRRLYDAGETVFAVATEGDTMLLLETGRAEVSVRSPDGRKTVLNHLGPGDLVGDIALLDRGPRSADVVAATPVTGLLVTRSDVMAVLAADPEATLALLGEVCRKARATIATVETLGHRQASARLARCLLQLGARWGTEQDGAILLAGRFSQTDLGEIAGLARENVNRLLRAWSAQGVVRLDQGGLRILDPRALTAASGA